jgi:alcohol dehydrogenase class IV
MRFEFATATRIVFGIGSIKEAGRHAASMGRHAFVITGRNIDRAASLIAGLEENGLKCSQFSIAEEPTTDLALAAVREARRQNCDVVVGIGGGSVLDTGKVVAALLTNSGDLMDYLEVIGAGRPLQHASAPYIAIPTTAGTGAEVTRNAVLDSPAHHVKVSMRSPFMLPKLALVDPALTFTMPPSITAGTGLDAFTQLLEAFVSHQANPLTDAVCREGLQRAARSLKKACLDSHNADARCDMSLASLFGGLALANAKLGAVHGFAGPLGGMYTAAHGELCAGLLPHVMDINVKALRSRSPESKALERYDEIARIVTARPTARAADGIARVRDLCLQLKVPPLAKYGIKAQDFAVIVDKARRASSMKGNPIELTGDELLEILQRAV